MFILKFIRYIRGYVQFYAQGAFVERFLNLAARAKVPIWDGVKRGDRFTGKTFARTYRKLRPAVRKTHVRLRVQEKRGLPFRRYQYRRRTGLLIGAAVFIAFIFVTSRFIWRVEVEGNGHVPEAQIIAALEDLGVVPGTLRSSIDVRGAERRALLKLDDLTWIALNIRGSTVHVAVKERVEPPLMIDPASPCNVVAARSGQITSMMVYSGQAMKSVGDTVLEGDIIVSGITEDKLGQNLFKHARASVTADVQHQIVVETPLEQTHYVETGEVRNKYFFQVFGWDFPLSWPRKNPKPYHVERGRSALAVAGVELPIAILHEEYILMAEEPISYSEKEAKELSLQTLAIRQETELSGAVIQERTLTGSLRDGVFVLRAEFRCTMDIAEEKVILK